MSMVALGVGVGVAAVGTVGGALLTKAMTPKPPRPDTKGATKGVKKANASYEKQIGDYLQDIDRIAGSIQSPQVDWLGAADAALSFNEANNGRFQALARSQSLSGTETMLMQQKLADPRFEEKRDQADENNLALMKGEVPIDVQQTLARSGAFQSLQGGFGGSGMDRALRARDLGVTSMEFSQQGEKNAQTWTNLLSDSFVKPAFVSPFQVMQFSGISADRAITSAFQQGDLDLRANLGSANILASGAGNALQARGQIYGVASGMPIQMMQANYAGDQAAWQNKAQQAQMIGSSVASAAGMVGGGIAGNYAGMAGAMSGAARPNAAGGFNSLAGAQAATAPPVAGSSFSYNPTRGWTPRATAVS